MMKDFCETYCSHGGVCELDAGHEGPHDSGYCTWTNEEAISRDAADELLAARGPEGRAVQLLWELGIPRKEEQ